MDSRRTDKKDFKNRILVTTPDGWDLSFFEGQYGPCLAGTCEGQKKFLSVSNAQKDILTPELAVQLWRQKFIGTHQGEMIEYNVGKYGGYLKWNGKNYNCPTHPSSVEDAVNVIEKKVANPSQPRKDYWKHEDEAFRYNYGEGQYGPYIRITHKGNGVTKFVSWKPEDGAVNIENIFKKLQNNPSAATM